MTGWYSSLTVLKRPRVKMIIHTTSSKYCSLEGTEIVPYGSSLLSLQFKLLDSANRQISCLVRNRGWGSTSKIQNYSYLFLGYRFKAVVYVQVTHKLTKKLFRKLRTHVLPFSFQLRKGPHRKLPMQHESHIHHCQ